MFKILTFSSNFSIRNVGSKKYQKFLDLIRPATGSKIPLTQQQKDKINQQIDYKMQQLQDSGLSREEILLSKSQKGLPLKIDPFFQFLKHNKLAREIYLKENERFTAEKVVDIALRQDIGLDPSYSRIEQSNKIQMKGRSQHLVQLGQRGQQSLDPASYYSNHQFSIQRAFSQLKKSQPVKHIYRPIDKYTKLKDHLRKLKRYDIHWRNVQLLRQFVTKNGNIKNRMNNLLSVQDQTRVMKSIKTARHMGVMPHYGRTPQPLKRNITTLEDQVQQIGYQHINIQTGHLYFSRSKSMDSLQVDLQKSSDIQYKYGKMLKQGKNYRLWVENLQQKDQQDVKTEQYARYLKNQENKNKNRKVESTIQERVVKKITGLDVYGEKKGKYEAINEKDNKQAYEKKGNS